MLKSRILTVSSANIDLMARMSTIPTVGQTLKSGEGYDFLPGGKGANTAHAVARLGGDSLFCARLGYDSQGVKLKKMYAESGIDTTYVDNDSTARTGLAIVMVEKNGNNRIVAYPGANNNLSASDVEGAMTSYPDAVIVQFEIPEKAVLATVKYAAAKQIPLIVDAAPAIKSFPLKKLGRVEIFTLNESEAFAYTGIHPSNPDLGLKVFLKLEEMVDAKYYVIKMGSKGVYYYDRRFHYVITAHNVTVVDTTAAGDVFNAALTLEYLRSRDIRRACAYANVAGALAVTKQGAYHSAPDLDELNDFMHKNGVQL